MTLTIPSDWLIKIWDKHHLPSSTKVTSHALTTKKLPKMKTANPQRKGKFATIFLTPKVKATIKSSEDS